MRQRVQKEAPWTDGTPRVVPIWFHWTGDDLVLGTPSTAPKLKALARHPKVALTIDEVGFPPKVLLVRGTATLQNRFPSAIESAMRRAAL